MSALALLALSLLATEGDYVTAYCKGEIEAQLPDRTRVDCLLPDEAQEYDFGVKSYEAIGQALWYAMNTGRRAAVVLIIEDSRDERGLVRARLTIAHYGLPITLRVIDAEGWR